MIDVGEVVAALVARIEALGPWSRASVPYETFAADPTTLIPGTFALSTPESVDTHKTRSTPTTGAYLSTTVGIKLAVGVDPVDQSPAADAGLVVEAEVRNQLLARSEDPVWPGPMTIAIDRYQRANVGSLHLLTLTLRVSHLAPLS